MKKSFISLISLALLSGYAFAGGISGPVSFPSAKVLPKGVRNMQYKGIYLNGNSKYDQMGNSQGLGASFNKVLTYQDLVNNEATVQDQLFAEAKVNNTPGIGLEDSMGETTGEVNLAVNVHTPVLAYGLTRAWTMAIVVPIVQSDLNVDVGSVSNESLQNAANFFAAPGQGMQAKLEEVQRKFAAATQNKLRDNGYKPLTDEKKSALGDIRLISKYNMFHDKNKSFTFISEAVLPTGKRSDVNKLVDVGSGDEQLDLGVGMAADTNITGDFQISGSVNYLVQLADRKEMRIRENADSKITPDKDSNTRRDLGDIFQTAIAGSYRVFESLLFQTGYSYQRKGADKYSGSKFAASRYDLLSDETDQEMHSFQAGLSFDTISMYRRKEFSVPMSIGLGYTKPLSGKNVIQDELTTLNMSIFF
ncbi:MAG: hypothetical protein HN509_09825 [Halobacteriovoraceae bacterium]|jgi:hypothetical protein|nr:hypothetical protein [Halobacteriovoraceae bacterium]